MKRMIRVTVEIYRPNDSTDYYELPDEWDGMTAEQRDAYLTELAVDEVNLAAGSGACVVEVDEDGKEIRVLDEDEP